MYMQTESVPQKRNGEVLYSAGEFKYKLDIHWAKWPQYISERLEDEQLSGLATDQDDHVYALNRTQAWPIVVFDQNGDVVRTFGENSFVHAHHMHISHRNTLWCADDRGHVIKEFSLSGECLRTLGTGVPSDSGYDESVPWPRDLWTIKRAAPPFYRPTGMYEAPWGELYASDGYANASVHRFSAEGALLQTWGGPGEEPGKFRLPHGIWVDVKERVWIADRENNRVEIFTKEGGFIKSIEKMLYPSDFWSDGKHMYVAEATGGVSIFDMDMNLLAQIGYENSPLQPHSITGNSRGDLFLGTMTRPYKLVKLIRI